MGLDEPEDAAAADTGEPGYLDRPQGGGGKRRGRKHRDLPGYHAPEVSRNPDGTFQVGRAIKVKPSPTDPNFAQAALADLATMSTTPQGRARLASLDGSGKSVTIEHRPAGPGNHGNADTSVEPGTLDGVRAATAPGVPLRDEHGQVVTDSAGNPVTGTGTGSDSVIRYDPSEYPVPTALHPGSQHNEPSDAVLNHELTHADNNAHGRQDLTPTGDGFDTVEERNVIGNPNGPDNTYRDERGVDRRRDHQDF
jgi:hypothetical protein